MTDASGAIVRRAVYTAFGEPVFEDGTVGTRYGYGGAWGYQGSSYPPSGDPPTTGDPLADLGWLHVGARYYDPAAGRFMQRDPIGIAGGLNTYVYAFNCPTMLIDPDGMSAGDFAAGAASVLSFGLSDLILEKSGADVNKCSPWYTAGQVAGVAATITGGVTLGARAAAFRPGKEFSHFVPRRWGGPRRWWNGNFVSPRFHHMTDYRRRLDRGWRFPHGIRQLLRVPFPFSFGTLGGTYGGISAETGGISGGCGCN